LPDTVHTFDNGIKVFRHHLLKAQLQRYQEVNLHEPFEERWVRHCLDNMGSDRSLFLDVGAGIGYYGILSKLHSPDIEIHLFEPNPTLREAIQANIGLNKLSERDMHIIPFAVSAQTGRGAFYLRDFSSSLIQGPRSWTLKLVDMYWRLTGSSRIIGVNTITLDELLVRMSKSVGLIKIDVQGMELQVLRGAACSLSQKVIEFLVIGTHSRRIHRKCMEFLGDHDCEFLFDAPVVDHQQDGLIVCRV
jgi:FkbM family methyltransferase